MTGGVDARLRGGRAELIEAVGLTVNEIHAFVLGIGVGWLAAQSWPTAIAAAVGWRRWGGIAPATVRREPWYFAGGLVVGYRAATEQ